MAETKPFKTKLCVLYQRGRCDRQSCSFAHGHSELRRFSASFPDRRNIKGNDLRNKLDRRHSPQHGYSPRGNAPDRHRNQRFSPSQPVKRRKYGTHDYIDGHSAFSGSAKNSDGTAHREKGKQFTVTDSRNMLEDELKQVQYEVDVLLHQRDQLEMELEERTQEADTLSSRIRDLEAMLSEEKDISNRVNSKIKKLIRAHADHTRAQDELKSSQVQLETLVEEVGLDAMQLVANKGNAGINIVSDEVLREPTKFQISLVKKQLCSSMRAPEVKFVKGQEIRVEESSWRNSHVHLDGDREAEVGNKKKDIACRQSSESKSKRRKDASKGSASSDKRKVLESNTTAPPTSMAAHAVDEFPDHIEAEETPEVAEIPVIVENSFPCPLPPFPPVSQNNYSQYEGTDEKVDEDGSEEELEEVEIV